MSSDKKNSDDEGLSMRVLRTRNPLVELFEKLDPEEDKKGRLREDLFPLKDFLEKYSFNLSATYSSDYKSGISMNSETYVREATPEETIIVMSQLPEKRNYLQKIVTISAPVPNRFDYMDEIRDILRDEGYRGRMSHEERRDR